MLKLGKPCLKPHQFRDRFYSYKEMHEFTPDWRLYYRTTSGSIHTEISEVVYFIYQFGLGIHFQF